jgi:hypothetical protein
MRGQADGSFCPLLPIQRAWRRNRNCTSTELDQANRLKLMSQEALKALGSLPQSKETKSLTYKIQGRL